MSTTDHLTEADVLALPLTVDLPTAGRAFGMSRDSTYRHARAGEFPVPVVRVGRGYRVTRAALLTALGITPPAPDPVAPLSRGPFPQVTDTAADARSAGSVEHG
jgi:hypothetical protein